MPEAAGSQAESVGSAPASSQPARNGAPDVAPSVPGTWKQRALELEEALHEAQEEHLRLQQMLDFAADGHIVTDTHGIILHANHAIAALLQRERSFLIDRPLALLAAPYERSAFYQRLTRLRSTGILAPWKTSLRGAADNVLHVLVSAVQIVRSARERDVFQWRLRDVSGAVQTEQHLVEQIAFSESLVDMVAAAVLVVDDRGRILRSNRYIHAISGHTADELQGADWCEVLLPETDRTEARQLIQRARTNGADQSGMLGLITPRRPRAFVWSARTLAEETELSQLVLLGYDVTDLQEAQERALQAERLAAIGQMVAGLAHESRNALQCSQACIEMLRWRVHDQLEAVDLVNRIERAQDVLYRLYEEVHEFAAPIRLDPSRCNLREIWQQAWADLEIVRRGRDAQLSEAGPPLDLHCFASSFHLKQVFRNILENCLAAAHDPVRIVISCSAESYDGRDAFRISIRDNGPGFDTKDTSAVFEPFFTTKTHGTGLGLAICKRILDAHGGGIAAESAPGGGAQIIILLPRRPR